MLNGIKSKKRHDLSHIFEPIFTDELRERNYEWIEGLQELIKEYKAKRNIWEVKLKADDDPRRHDFYAIIARLAMLDIIIADLEHLKQILLVV